MPYQTLINSISTSMWKGKYSIPAGLLWTFARPAVRTHRSQ